MMLLYAILAAIAGWVVGVHAPFWLIISIIVGLVILSNTWWVNRYELGAIAIVLGFVIFSASMCLSGFIFGSTDILSIGSSLTFLFTGK